MMLVDDFNRYEVARWCNGMIARDGMPGLIVSDSINGKIRAMPGDIIVKFNYGFMVFAPKENIGI